VTEVDKPAPKRRVVVKQVANHENLPWILPN
jgi:hypothetical protein